MYVSLYGSFLLITYYLTFQSTQHNDTMKYLRLNQGRVAKRAQVRFYALLFKTT